jgi:hypothetical protein
MNANWMEMKVKNARKLMQQVWVKGAAWWELVNGEFLG